MLRGLVGWEMCIEDRQVVDDVLRVADVAARDVDVAARVVDVAARDSGVVVRVLDVALRVEDVAVSAVKVARLAESPPPAEGSRLRQGPRGPPSPLSTPRVRTPLFRTNTPPSPALSHKQAAPNIILGKTKPTSQRRTKQCNRWFKSNQNASRHNPCVGLYCTM